MAEELLVTATEVVKTTITVGGNAEPVLRALTITCKEILTLPALPWQGLCRRDDSCRINCH